MSNQTIIRRSLDDWKAFCEHVAIATSVNARENERTQEARKKRALKDYNYFVQTYLSVYADCDCADFQVKAAKEIKADKSVFAVLEWPREHAKSVHAIIGYPMWLLAHNDLNGMILMGKNETDAQNLLSDLQAQLQFNELFIHDFGEQYNTGDWQEGDFTTRSGIRFVAIGRDQSPRGFRKNEKRPDYAVVSDIDDDIIVHNTKRVEAIVDRILGALYFALSIKGARLVVEGNRIHPRGILAHIVGDTTPKTPKRKGIYHSKVFATDGGYYQGKPSWWQRYTLAQLRAKMDKAGIVRSKKEFYHDNAIEGKIFKNKYFNWQKPPSLKRFDIIEGYLDPSFENSATSDFKAVRVWGLCHNKFWCLKSFVRRCPLEEAFHFMYDFEDSLPEGVKVVWRVEKQFVNKLIKQAIERVKKERGRYLSIITDSRTKPNKYTRIVRMEPMYYSNDVIYNINEKHDPDMIEGNNQLMGIEPGYRSPDDSPDADEGAWFYLTPHIEKEERQARVGRRSFKSKTW
jgi:hypothetical protein